MIVKLQRNTLAIFVDSVVVNSAEKVHYRQLLLVDIFSESVQLLFVQIVENHVIGYSKRETDLAIQGHMWRYCVQAANFVVQSMKTRKHRLLNISHEALANEPCVTVSGFWKAIVTS